MFRRLIPKEVKEIILWYLGKYRRDFTVLGILSVISAITNAVVPFLAGRLIDSIVAPNAVTSWGNIALSTSIIFVTVWFSVKVAADIADRQIGFESERLGNIIHADYLTRGVARVLELPLSFHKKAKLGAVFDRINRATEWLYQILSRLVIDLAPQLLSLVLAIIITFIINPLLSLIIIGGLVLYVVILVRVTPGLALLQKRVWSSYNLAYGQTLDTLTNVQAVKQATAEPYEVSRTARSYKRAAGLWIDLNAVWQNLTLYQKLLVSLTQLVIFVISIFMIRTGSMTIGELVMFNGYAAMLFGPFIILSRNWQTIQNGMVAVLKAERMLKAPSEVYEPKKAINLPDIEGMIQFKDVSFRYQKTGRVVLDRVTFKVTPGKMIALVGESGVGKTSLIDLISFYYRPISGTIYVDGHNIKTLNLHALRSHIAVVPQEIVLFNDTVKNNIRYGRFEATDEEVAEAARLAHADEFVRQFPRQYNQLVGERGIKLSTGQKQRIAIARAILRNPRILVLDEPTSALDAQSEKFIAESLATLMKGRTTFIIAHRFSTVKGADEILVLKQGKIVETGTHEELLAIINGTYKRLYELQVGLT